MTKLLPSGLWTHRIEPIQYCLMLGSALWACFLLWEGDTFERPVYDNMKGIFSEDLWGLLYLFHAVLLLAQLLRPTEFPGWSKMTVSIFGCALWTATYTALLIFPLPAALAPGMVLASASWWVVVRTDCSRLRRKTDVL